MNTSGLTPYQLRFCPASYLHESQLPSNLGIITTLLPSWRELPAVNETLLDTMKLDTDYELPPVLGGIALFPQLALTQLLCYLGVVMHGEAIRHCVQASVLRQLIPLIGEEGLRVVLSQHELLIGNWPAGWQKPMPDLLNLNFLEQAGLQFWLSAAREANPQWSLRLKLRLPLSSCVHQWKLSTEQLPLAKVLCLKISRQVTPQCCHLLM